MVPLGVATRLLDKERDMAIRAYISPGDCWLSSITHKGVHYVIGYSVPPHPSVVELVELGFRWAAPDFRPPLSSG